ncbi:phage portal protein [Actinomyces sp. MRS3W]|uniref:phage portal protein n=1 Tax=Actinomyces sp. MRS3W TaxID=2800796 RepID=UPI0028FD5D10|nr:phage portal protein [Actinomyces sp. MRS3W]MDU0349029.1 phage portal protein [Actinomyces sp. MRS3W]
MTETAVAEVPMMLPGLTDAEQALVRRLHRKWESVRAKNALLDVYYDGHRAFQDLGISIPPQMQHTRAALGWPAKAVKALARKHIFEGYALDGSTDPFELGELLARNDFEVELAQAINSAYKHAVAFLTVTKGGDGEPPVVIQARDANWTAALWDRRTRTLKAAMAVTDIDDDGHPTAVTVYTREAIITATRDRGAWSTSRTPQATGRVLVEPLVYDPQLGRPFGHSRISREVRYLTDAAVRTMVRAETSAEFFSSPQRYVLGADADAFKDISRWTAITGRITALEANENGDIPTMGQFAQMSMEPHLSMYRQLAQNFCAETNLPQSSVGLFADNPTSAEAMLAAEAALAGEADYQWHIFTGPLRRIAEDAVMLRDGSAEPPAESWRLAVKYTPTTQASPAAQSDYIVKLVQALPQVADTTVALRKAGLTTEEIDEIRSERRTAGASSVLDRLAAAQSAGVGEA